MADVETLGILDEIQVLVSVKLQVVTTNNHPHPFSLWLHTSIPRIIILSKSAVKTLAFNSKLSLKEKKEEE